MLATSAAFLIVDDGAFAIVHLTPVENLLCPISHTVAFMLFKGLLLIYVVLHFD